MATTLTKDNLADETADGLVWVDFWARGAALVR